MRDINDQITSSQNSRAKFKQRVAGGAVLLIVLAIFLPFIFNHSHVGTVPAPVDNTVANTTPAAQTVAQPADQAANQAAPAQSVAANNPAAQAPAAAPATEAAPVAQAPAAQPDDQAAVANQSMRSDQAGLTPPQSESAPTAAPVQQAQPPSAAAAPPVEQLQAAPAAAPSAQQPQPAVNTQQPQAAAAAATQATQPPVARQVQQQAKILPPPVKTTARTAATSGRWMVQVGSFTQPQYAQQLVANLRDRGLHAYTQRESNNLTRVYIGPIASEQQAQKIQQQIQAEFHLSSLVREKRA